MKTLCSPHDFSDLSLVCVASYPRQVLPGTASGKARYRLHMKLQLTYPGGGKRPGYMRVFVAEENCKDNDNLVTVIIPDYIAIWNLDLHEYKAYCRYTLIDTVTGYRNLAQEYSFDMKITEI